MKGKLILVVAPSGSGKDTLMKHVKGSFPELVFFVSHTTRSPRAGEMDGINYHFVSREEFEDLVQHDGFLEWAEYAGNFYGTSKKHLLDALEAGKILFTDMEIQGVQQVLKCLPRENIVTIFIDAGGWDVLRHRIERRAKMSKKELNERHERYLKEVAFKEKADYIVKNPEGGLDQAKQDISKIIQRVMESIGN